MKGMLKLLLGIGLLFAGIYAATPFWLPALVAKQLPPGWQLERLDSGYWGLSGIDIREIRVKGGLQLAAVELIGSDIRLAYKGLRAEVGLLVMDVRFLAAEDRVADALTLNDFSFPVTELTTGMPELTIQALRMNLHHDIDMITSNPLVLKFQSLEWTPGANDDFSLNTIARLESVPGANGRVRIEKTSSSLIANMKLAMDEDAPPWLSVGFEQHGHAPATTTQVQADFDAAAADREWLDSLLAQVTGGKLTQVTGNLNVKAGFEGKETQAISKLSLLAEGLQAKLDGGTVSINAALSGSREDEKITIWLLKPAEIQFYDKEDEVREWITKALPGLQLASGSETTARTEIGTGGIFVIQAGEPVSMAFDGQVQLSMSSAKSRLSLLASSLKVQIDDLSRPDVFTAEGLVDLDWAEQAPFSFSSDDLHLKADSLSLAGSGNLLLSGQTASFKPVGGIGLELGGVQAKLQTGTSAEPAWFELDASEFSMQGQLNFVLPLSDSTAVSSFGFDGPVTATNPRFRIPADEHAQPTTITADDISVNAALTAYDGTLVSAGSGTLFSVYRLPEVTSATRIDITWQDLDVVNLTGNLSTKTQGFATVQDGETWTGFDVDITYSLLTAADMKGSGTVMVDSGPDIPIVFEGNTLTQRWNVSLPASRMQLSQLGGLLRVANVSMPKSVKLTGGYIDMQGDVEIADEIKARMMISGRELGASLLESSANEASFTFTTSYGDTISVKGPLSVQNVLLAGGVEVSDIRAELSLETLDNIGLRNLRADIFEGQFELGEFRYSEGRFEDTVAELKRINLGRLLAFVDLDGLEGTGNLDFSLPAGSDQAGAYVKGGTFNSIGPGRLAYTKEGVAGSNIGLQALENFQYKRLSGTIDYQSGGAYQIGVRLEGRNPDLYGGHPVVFNLNISGFLPELFEALFITGDFEESILNQVRNK